jgi:hypothetical protein
MNNRINIEQMKWKDLFSFFSTMKIIINELVIIINIIIIAKTKTKRVVKKEWISFVYRETFILISIFIFIMQMIFSFKKKLFLYWSTAKNQKKNNNNIFTLFFFVKLYFFHKYESFQIQCGLNFNLNTAQ